MAKLKYFEPFEIHEYFDSESMAEVLRATDLTESQKALFVILFDIHRAVGSVNITQVELAKISGVSVRQVRRIISFLKDFQMIRVSKALRSSHVYFLYNECYDDFVSPEEVPAKPVAPQRKSPTLMGYKDKLFDKIKDAYHPLRSKIQPVTAREAFEKACREASRPYASREGKKTAIRDVFEKIITYIQYLQTTRTWTENDGRYLLGLGNMLKGGMWRNHIPTRSSTTEKSALKEIFGR